MNGEKPVSKSDAKSPTQVTAAHETRSDRFRRLATKRTTNVLQALRVLGNCAHRGQYDYTEEEVKKIFAAIEKQLSETKAKFREPSKFEFKL